MFRLFLALNFLLLNLLACKGGYESCKLKIVDSKTLKYQNIQMPIIGNKRVVFSRHIPNAKVIKHDPFLSLYLIKDRTKFKYPFKINNQLTLGIASVNNKRAIEGRIVKRQIGLNNLATFSERVDTPALLLDSCCDFEAFVTRRGIIEKEYIQRFIKSKTSEYGDIGIRVDDKKSLVIVKRVNPFLENNSFEIDDCVVLFDGKKIKDSATLMRKILFSKVGSSHSVKVKRGSKYLTFKVKTQKRYGGGYISDTFLEEKGLYFSENLTILKITNEFNGYGLKVGDRLIQVNGKKVENLGYIAKYLSEFKERATLLFERNHFQFFVDIN